MFLILILAVSLVIIYQLTDKRSSTDVKVLGAESSSKSIVEDTPIDLTRDEARKSNLERSDSDVYEIVPPSKRNTPIRPFPTSQNQTPEPNVIVESNYMVMNQNNKLEYYPS
jgi:hypothetical protein